MKINWVKGFTLIELLIVIAILGVLAAGVVVAVNPLGKLNSANLAKAKTFSASVENALIMSQVGKWSFEEGSGNIVKDISGYGNNGTLNGGVTWKTSAECGLGFGGCLSFDGVNGYVRTASAISFANGIPWTAEIWIKSTESSGWWQIWLGGSSGEYYEQMGFVTETSLYFANTSGSSVQWAVPSTLNKWTHFVFVGSPLGYSGQVEVYRNGISLGKKTPSAGSYMKVGTIGMTGNGERPTSGLIDEVKIYNQALLSSRIQQIYAQGLIKHQLALK